MKKEWELRLFALPLLPIRRKMLALSCLAENWTKPGPAMIIAQGEKLWEGKKVTIFYLLGLNVLRKKKRIKVKKNIIEKNVRLDDARGTPFKYEHVGVGACHDKKHYEAKKC